MTALRADPVDLAPVGIGARAHWSLYPLLDGGATTAAAVPAAAAVPLAAAVPPAAAVPLAAAVPPAAAQAPVTDHMTRIYEAIEHSKAAGIFSGSDHFATRLDGDLSDVLATVANAWVGVGRNVQHVVTHVTVSMNSPSLG